MKIYTRTGDDGETGLFGGDRVVKHHPRIEAYGTVDEVNAFVGLARAACPETEKGAVMDALLERIQNDLFVVGADLATPDESRASVPRIGPDHAKQLEDDIDRLEADLEPLRQFILPGGHPCAAALHTARTVCRRAERATVSAIADVGIDHRVAIYLNRLSDFLFVAARWVNLVTGKGDSPWKP
jgi:cob(I)alamin adenosyltransferase